MFGNKNLPEWGLLSGVKVVSACQSTAGPFAAQILADFGADVLWIENAKQPDLTRFTQSYCIEAQHHNMRNMALNIPTEEGKKILLGMLKDSDIFIETSKGGQYDKWGLTDEVLWEANPKLIICHISGFGQTGEEEYIHRASYDSIAQAFSGVMWLNRPADPDAAPQPIGAYAGDFYSALWAALSCCAALNKVKETGQGEMIDLAQYEAIAICQQYQSDWFTDRKVPVSATPFFTPESPNVSVMKCKDGNWIQFCFSGAGIQKKAIEFLGLDYGSELFPEGISIVIDPEATRVYNEALHNYFDSKTADEAMKEMSEAGLPVQKVNTLEDFENDPQVKARGDIYEWETFKGDKVRAVLGVPKLTNNPFQLWRAAPWMGMDNEEVLTELGYTPEEIKELYQNHIISKDPDGRLSPPMDMAKLMQK